MRYSKGINEELDGDHFLISLLGRLLSRYPDAGRNGFNGMPRAEVLVDKCRGGGVGATLLLRRYLLIIIIYCFLFCYIFCSSTFLFCYIFCSSTYFFIFLFFPLFHFYNIVRARPEFYRHSINPDVSNVSDLLYSSCFYSFCPSNAA